MNGYRIRTRLAAAALGRAKVRREVGCEKGALAVWGRFGDLFRRRVLKVFRTGLLDVDSNERQENMGNETQPPCDIQTPFCGVGLEKGDVHGAR